VADKNVRPLAGHPVMAYAISTAIQSGVFDHVIVSTDDPEYARIARHYGAEVPCLRPAEIATATSPDIEWVEHMLRHLRADGQEYDCFSILRPTSPFRGPDTIRRAWDAFRSEEGVDSLRAVERVSQHPGKMWVVRGRRMLPLMPLSPAEQPWHSTQMAALPEVYVQNASLEIAWTRLVWSGGNIAGVVLMPFLTSDIEGFDINNQYDWDLCEAMLARGDARLPEVHVAPYPGRAPQ
jgi:CMP-N-acetylneuraminic acid synthetase